MKNRILKLAKNFSLTPTEKTWINQDYRTKMWWLVECKEGEWILPGTRGCKNIDEALENVEGWLAPELNSSED